MAQAQAGPSGSSTGSAAALRGGWLWRSTWRRMSFIGSTERTRGTTSKLLAGGGEVVNHSSVLAFHGSGPAIAPLLDAAHDVDDRHQHARARG